MTLTSFSERTTIVVGASRDLGRGIATSVAEVGAPIVAVARSRGAPAELAHGAANIQTEVADAADPRVAGALLDRHAPSNLILVAGASPLVRGLQHETWETFSVIWHTDVRIAFNWLRESLLKPLPGIDSVSALSGRLPRLARLEGRRHDGRRGEGASCARGDEQGPAGCLDRNLL